MKIIKSARTAIVIVALIALVSIVLNVTMLVSPMGARHVGTAFDALPFGESVISGLDAENSNLATRNKNLVAASEGWLAVNSELMGENRNLKDENENLQDSNDVLADDNKRLEFAAEGLLIAGKSLNQENLELMGENENLAAANEGLEAANEGLESENSELATENKDLVAIIVRLLVTSSELAIKNRNLVVANAGLVARNSKLMWQRRDLKAKNKATHKIIDDIRKRTFRGAIRNIIAIPAEAIPYVGAFAVVGVTGLEIKDACETLTDLKEINPEMGSTFEEDGFEVNLDGGEFCGLTIPSMEDFKSKFAEAWEALKKRGVNLPDSEDRPSLWERLKERVQKFWGDEESPETSG